MKYNYVIIIIIFLVLNLLSLGFYSNVWWDSAVYAGMGKYIYSLGDSGIWESSRPIVLPIMLGFLWKIGLNPIFFGRILEITAGSLVIFFTYLIGKRLFGDRTALLASLFIAISPTFFFFNGVLLTGVVSTLFSLIAVYYFLEKKYIVSGLFFGIAFMTRFLQLFVFISVILIMAYLNKHKIRNLYKMIIGFVLALLPYLILNQIVYNNALFPFLHQIFLSANSGWPNYHGLGFYFIGLFKENFLYLLSIIGILIIFKKKDPRKMPIVAIFLLFFIFFNLINQKEMRFLILLFPYMYLLISYSVMYLSDKHKKYRTAVLSIVVLSLIFSGFNIFTLYKAELNKNNPYNEFQDKFMDANGKIWISNPITSVLSDNKVDKIIYYPVFNEEKKNELMSDIGQVDFVFMDSCDLACSPSDSKCEDNKEDLLKFFKQELRITHSSSRNQCQQFVFTSLP
tara:strand:+ start:15529 stop:16890 length:1362 start_codon:yes stop_codon:yes gene_type:complete